MVSRFQRGLGRFALLVASCVLIVSCASGPTPATTTKDRDDSELDQAKKKKKKKKKRPRRRVDVAEADDEREDDDDNSSRPMTQRQRNAEARKRWERENRGESDDEDRGEADDADEEREEDDDDADDDDGDEQPSKRQRAAEARAKKDREAKAKREAAAKAKAEREAKAKAEREEREEREAKAKAEREERAAKAKAEREEREAKAKAEREAKATRAAEDKAKRERARANADEEEEDEEEEEEEEEEEDEEPVAEDADEERDDAKAERIKAEKAKADKAKADKAKADKARADKARADKARAEKASKARAKTASEGEVEIDMTDVGEEPRAPAEDEEEPAEDEEDTSPPRDESLDDPLAQPRVAAIQVPGVGDPDDEDTDTVEAPSAGARLPINDRALTLPKRGLEVHGGLRVGLITITDPVAMTTTSSTSQSLALGGTYGLSDRTQIGADYAIGVSPGSIKGPFAAHIAYRAVLGGKLEVALVSAFAVDFATVVNSTTMTTSTTTLAGLQLGAWARYRITPKVSLFTGQPALPTTSPSQVKLALPLPPFTYQVAIGLNNAGTIGIDLPVGLGIQASKKLYAFAALDLAHVRIANTENAFVFADFIPVALGAYYSLSKLDLGFTFADDLKQGTDYLRFDAMVRYSIR